MSSITFDWRLLSSDKTDKSNYPDHSGLYHCLLSDGSLDVIPFIRDKQTNELDMKPTVLQISRFIDEDICVLAWFPNPVPVSDDALCWIIDNYDDPKVSVFNEDIWRKSI